MSRTKPIARAIRLLSIIERNANGLRVMDMADQLGAPPRSVYRDLDVLQQLRMPIYTDKNGRESFWKIDPTYRSQLSIPFTLSELLSLYFAQDSIRPLQRVCNDLNGLNDLNLLNDPKGKDMRHDSTNVCGIRRTSL
jgi:predicted DNA-binding transcriptional regulator YafY